MLIKLVPFVGFYLLCLFALIFAQEVKDWEAFKSTFDKNYPESDEKFRREVFLNNTRIIDELNEQYRRKGANFRCEVNHFTDLTQQEFLVKFTGLKMKSSVRLQDIQMKHSRKKTQRGTDHDWRQFGAVTPVESQEECGSCWIFSANGAIESQLYLKTMNLLPLSEQYVLDCLETPISSGCNGGYMTDVFEYAMKHGISFKHSYRPYRAQSCHCNDNNDYSKIYITSYASIPPGSEAELEHAVATVGPVSVGIDASQPSLQFYAQGIYFDPVCNKTEVNHAVLVVGFGVAEDGTEYWIVKNSWSEEWGEAGYFRMLKGSNMCGIATLASYPLI